VGVDPDAVERGAVVSLEQTNEAPPDPQDHVIDPAEEDPRVRRVELIISALLRTGVVTSAAIILIGAVLTFAQAGNGTMSTPADLKRILAPDAQFPHGPRNVLHGLRALRGEAVIILGLLVLLATPVMRVAVSILAFAYQRDRTFVAITALVLALLILSFFLGHAAG
jgi:uncharacterized membrane protein